MIRRACRVRIVPLRRFGGRVRRKGAGAGARVAIRCGKAPFRHWTVSPLDRRRGSGVSPTVMDSEDVMRRIELLKQEHRDLDSAIVALAESGATDQLQLARLKKRKLLLRDEVSVLEDSLVPDIIA